MPGTITYGSFVVTAIVYIYHHIHTYIHTYIPTYLPTYLHTYITPEQWKLATDGTDVASIGASDPWAASDMVLFQNSLNFSFRKINKRIPPLHIWRLAGWCHKTTMQNSRKTDLADLRRSRESDAGSTGFHKIAKDQVIAKVFTPGSFAFPMLHNPVQIAAVLWVNGQFMISLVVTLDTRKLTYCASPLCQTGNSGGELNLLIWHRLLRGHGHLRRLLVLPHWWAHHTEAGVREAHFLWHGALT